MSIRSPQYPSELFFQHNTALGPPFRVLIDTNFINFSIKNKLEIVRAMMDCLLAKCTWLHGQTWGCTQPSLCVLTAFPVCTGIPCVTDCVIAELEKLGPRFRIALR